MEERGWVKTNITAPVTKIISFFSAVDVSEQDLRSFCRGAIKLLVLSQSGGRSTLVRRAGRVWRSVLWGAELVEDLDKYGDEGAECAAGGGSLQRVKKRWEGTAA